MTASILVVDDEPDIRDLVGEILEDEGYRVTRAADGKQALGQIRQDPPDLILLDIWMPELDGISLLKELNEDGGLPSSVIMMSGHGTIETAVEATRLGAYDFVEKPIALAKLLLTVDRALETHRLKRENEGLRLKIQPVLEPVGKGKVMSSLRDKAVRLARHNTWVLLNGEAGTGKETVARYMHSNSSRNKGPFVSVNMGAIAPDNAAIELFGKEQDDKIHHGLLEQANSGILFLDSISEMDADAQNRLFSALESQSFLRVGGSQSIDVDVRVFSASSKDLELEVREGRFREDLYYRLNVVPLTLPTLREHREDVPDLVAHFARFFQDRDGLPYRHFSLAAQNYMRQYAWPGNIRQLKNLVQRMLVLGAGDEISAAEVEAALSSTGKKTADDAGLGLSDEVFEMPLREAREQFERQYLTRQLQKVGGSVGKLAKLVGLERTHLYRKLRSLDIDPKTAGQTESTS